MPILPLGEVPDVYRSPRLLKFLLNLYPPYLGAGVRVTHVAADWRELRVTMKLRWYNRNAVGTQFGGSLYTMVDPHLMLLLMQLLGREYLVWDQAAAIEFKKPGRGTVSARIRIDEETLAQIREATAAGSPYRPSFELFVRDGAGEVVTRVVKTLYVRRRPEEGAARGEEAGDD